eukprot:118471-Chlamydomonas_euryale.AAC.1
MSDMWAACGRKSGHVGMWAEEWACWTGGRRLTRRRCCARCVWGGRFGQGRAVRGVDAARGVQLCKAWGRVRHGRVETQFVVARLANPTPILSPPVPIPPPVWHRAQVYGFYARAEPLYVRVLQSRERVRMRAAAVAASASGQRLTVLNGREGGRSAFDCSEWEGGGKVSV